MFLAKLTGSVRGQSVPNLAEGEPGQPIGINPRGDVCVAQGLPPKSELVRMGKTWTCTIATGSAFTFVATWPTTRAELVLYNGNPIGGPSLVMDSAFLTNITSQAAAQPYSLLGQLAQGAGASPAVASPTNDTAQLIYSRSGKFNYTGGVLRAVANTAFALANRWEILGNSAISPMTTNLGASIYVDLFGGFIVPPGAVMCFAGLAGTAAGTAILGATWHEVQLTLP
jgi:hypothetical protein